MKIKTAGHTNQDCLLRGNGYRSSQAVVGQLASLDLRRHPRQLFPRQRGFMDCLDHRYRKLIDVRREMRRLANISGIEKSTPSSSSFCEVPQNGFCECHGKYQEEPNVRKSVLGEPIAVYSQYYWSPIRNSLSSITI